MQRNDAVNVGLPGLKRTGDDGMETSADNLFLPVVSFTVSARDAVMR